MSAVKFTATKINTQKQGRLAPDAEGYYEIIVGGLNTFNSAGEYYTLEGARELFQSSSLFMRMVQSSYLKSEYNHPQRTPGMTMDDYMRRIMHIDENNVCCHIKEVWLDETYGSRNPQHGNSQLVAIMAKIKPCGPKGPYLKEELENPNQNVAFSIRALTHDYYHKGQTMRVLKQIITFDKVFAPGIATSNKLDSPALECLMSQSVSQKQLSRLMDTPVGVGVESNVALYKACMKVFETPDQIQNKLIAKW